MTLVTPRRPSGFNEYLPGEQLEFNRLLTIIRDTYERYGFSPLDTPDLELTEVLLAKGGGETEKQVYSFTREGSDTQLTMRYDLTVPLARYVSEHQSDIVFPLWRYHIGKVHRAERAQAGRFREFYQCDIDVIGSKSPIVDAQFPAVINDIFEQFGFGEFVIRMSDRLVFDGFIKYLGLEDKVVDVLHAIDRIEKVTHEELVAELHKLGLNDEQTDKLLEFTSISGSNDAIIEKLNALGVELPTFQEGIERLRTLVQTLRLMGVPESRFQLDLKIVRGLDYYTGTVYETNLVDYPQIGSVCSGGRYDNLTSNYSKTELPGVGISIGLTRLFYALRQVGAIQTTQQSPAQAVIIPIDDAQLPFALEVASRLRTADISTMLNTEPGNLGKRLRYADRMDFPYVIVIGESEAASQQVTLKDMETGESRQLTVDSLLEELTV